MNSYSIHMNLLGVIWERTRSNNPLVPEGALQTLGEIWIGDPEISTKTWCNAFGHSVSSLIEERVCLSACVCVREKQAVLVRAYAAYYFHTM